MEKEIERRRNQLWEAEAGSRGDPDLDDLTFQEDDEPLAGQSEHLEDEDVRFINSIFNSFSSPTCYRQDYSQLKLKSSSTEDAPTRAWTPETPPPPKFNQNFNQNSTTRSSQQDHLSYFANAEYEGDSELGDYFSDDEENDTEINHNCKGIFTCQIA